MKQSHKYFPILFVVAGTLLFVPSQLHAAPAKIAHQGRLLNAQSQPVSTAVTVNFDVFDVAVGGSSVWSETQSITPDALGFYETFLGNVNPPPPVLPEPGYLQLTVNSEVLNPRLEIGSVPFSLQAGDISCSGCVVSADISTGTIVDANISETAAIAGSKITPDFGSQDVVTSGALRASGFELTACSDRVAEANSRTYTTLNTELDSDPSGQGICGAGWHVCNYQEVTVYSVLFGCQPPVQAWIVGGFSNYDAHRRSIWNGQDSVQCVAGNYPAWYVVPPYKGGVHCLSGSNVLKVACCKTI